MKKRILSLLLMVCMVLTMLPMSVFAIENYNVWVGGIEVTSANNDDVFGDGGSVKYDPVTKTLTLNNCTYSGEGYTEKGGYRRGAAIYAIGDISICLLGTNSVTQIGGDIA